MKLINKVLLLLCIFTLASCGYFSDDVVENAEIYSSDSLSGGCEINTDELSQILEKDVGNEIDCLESNLDKFAKYVKRDQSDAITDEELASFIRRFFEEHASMIVGSIQLMFEVNGLVLKDESTSLRTENIGLLFDLIKVANKRLYSLMKLVDGENNSKGDVDVRVRAVEVKNELKALTNQVNILMDQAEGDSPSSLNLRDFLEKIKNQFEINIFEDELLEAFFSLKKLFLGGDREILTREELYHFLDITPDLGAVSYTLYYADADDLGGNEELYSLYQEQVSILESHIYSHKRDEEIISESSVQSLINKFLPEEGITFGKSDSEKTITREDVIKLSLSLKENILGRAGQIEFYSFQEVKNFIKVMSSALSGLSFYESYKNLVGSTIEMDLWDFKRNIFITKANNLQEQLVKQWLYNDYFPGTITPIPFIEDVVDVFIKDFKYKEKIGEGFEVLKLLTVGGESDNVTKNQLIDFIVKLDDMAEIAFDLVFANEINHNDQEMRRLYFVSASKINDLIVDEPFLHIVTIEQLLSLASHFMDDESILNYGETVEKIKFKLFGGYPQTLTLKDVKGIISLASDFLGSRYFVDLSYDLYESEMNSKNGITKLSYSKSHDDFSLYRADQLLEYKQHFEERVTKLRLYRESDGTQYYGDDYKRTKFGMLEHYMVEFFFNLIAKSFGHKDEHNEYVLNIEEVNSVLAAFKPVLEELGLWTAKPETFGRNTLLLADLFQANSDGTMTINSLEASEYGTLALFAIDLGDKIYKKLGDYCNEYTRNGSTGYAVSCYRPRFFDLLMNEFGMAKKMPKLQAYMNSVPEEEVNNFLVSIEGFAKDYPEAGMPEARRDVILLVGALLNIESTFLRFDTNKSNLLDPQELEAGFPVYEEAIVSLAGLEGGKRKYAKTIFLYMIKEMNEPGTMDVMLYHYNPFSNKEISSKRLNIGALLYNMVYAKGQ